MDERTFERARGCLLGLAAADAVGTAVEFSPRDSFPPLTDLVGGGPFHLAPGQWTDDTSMALCLGVSLVERGGFDARDQMERDRNWREQGYLSATGRCFAVGGTVARALARFRTTGEAFAGSTDPGSAEAGCIMRLAPIPIFDVPDQWAIARYARQSSRTTHGAAGIPSEWLVQLAMREFADDLADRLLGAARHISRQPGDSPASIGACRPSGIRKTPPWRRGASPRRTGTCPRSSAPSPTGCCPAPRAPRPHQR